jgi:hypothetical protein
MSLKRGMLFVKNPVPRIELDAASLTWLGDTKRRLYRIRRLGGMGR